MCHQETFQNVIILNAAHISDRLKILITTQNSLNSSFSTIKTGEWNAAEAQWT